MSEGPTELDELRARIDAAARGCEDDPDSLARAAGARLGVVLDLIADGRGVRDAGSGLNAAAGELLVADALLTEAAARAAMFRGGDRIEPHRSLDLEALAERAGRIDEGFA